MTPDVNVLVAASRSDHVHHAAAKQWLDEAMASCRHGGHLEILPMVAAGFLRVVTNRGAFHGPTPTGHAVAFLRALLATQGVSMPSLGPEWPAFQNLCVELNLAANDVPDGWIAAAVTVNGLHLVTFDRGFAALLRPSEYTLLGARPGVREPKPRYGARRRAAGVQGKPAAARQ